MQGYFTPYICRNCTFEVVKVTITLINNLNPEKNEKQCNHHRNHSE